MGCFDTNYFLNNYRLVVRLFCTFILLLLLCFFHNGICYQFDENPAWRKPSLSMICCNKYSTVHPTGNRINTKIKMLELEENLQPGGLPLTVLFLIVSIFLVEVYLTYSILISGVQPSDLTIYTL